MSNSTTDETFEIAIHEANIEMPDVVNVNEKFLVSVIVSETTLTLVKLKLYAGDIYAGEV